MKRKVIETDSVFRVLAIEGEFRITAPSENGLSTVNVLGGAVLTRDELRQLTDFLTKVLKSPMPAEERAARWKAFGVAVAETCAKLDLGDGVYALYDAALESEGED